jgi:hypothetical protein
VILGVGVNVLRMLALLMLLSGYQRPARGKFRREIRLRRIELN